MRITGKLAILIGLLAFMASCQKEDMPSPSGCTSHQQDKADQRGSGPQDDNRGGSVTNDGDVTADSVVVSGGDDDRDGGGIVGHGDDDRDGGGVVGGGDEEGHDGGRMVNPGEMPK